MENMSTPVTKNASDLAEDFLHSFNISKPIENDTCRPHPKFSTYCRKFGSTSLHDDVKRIQDKRRQDMLENIKRKRESVLDKLRPLLNYVEEDIEIDLYNYDSTTDTVSNQTHKIDNIESNMQVDILKTKKGNKTRYKNRKDFSKLVSSQIMLSEWLVDVPSDFYTEWYMMCCPRGKRALVIASNGRTRVYSRTGYFMFQFESLLPGGSRSPSKHNIMTKSSIVDCVYVETEHKFYILDVITWNGCSFYDCETEFRFYWLHSSFSQQFQTDIKNKQDSLSLDINGDVEMIDHENEANNLKNSSHNILNQSVCKLYSFSPLKYYDCTMENIRKYINGPYQFESKIDGVLFYHKRAPYTPGITPLVCWLKVHMIPNILNIYPE